MTGTQVYLFRHGEVMFAETRRFIGHLDVPLSARGEAQCVAQSARLRDVPLTALYSSDLVRARRSGELLGASRGLVPVAVGGKDDARRVAGARRRDHGVVGIAKAVDEGDLGLGIERGHVARLSE